MPALCREALLAKVPAKELDFYFLPNGKEYDGDDGFSFNFEPNGIPFGL